MKNFLKAACSLTVAALLVVVTYSFNTSSDAQVGQLQSGQVWGNPTSGAAPATGTLLGPLLDKGYCSTQGDILFRGASLWTCLAPGTSGLPIISGGAGNNLQYGALANAALQNSSTTVNGVTCTLGSTCTISASAGTITVGTTTVAGATNTNILYNNAGVLGQYTVTGTGTQAVLSASPTFTGTPILSTPTATSIAIGGGSIGADALEVTGTTTFNSNVKLNGVSLIGTYTVGGTPSIAGSAINSGTVSGSFLSNINLATVGSNGGITGTLAVGNGGTGGTTGAVARANLNVESITSTGDANYVIQATDRVVYHTALSAARTDTLPAASAVNPGQTFVISDFAGVASATHTVTLQRAGADTINGVTTSVAINAQYGAGIFWSDGVSRWTFFPASTSGSGTVTNVTLASGNGISMSGTCTITTSGTCTFNGAVTEPQGRLTLAANTPVMSNTSCSGSPCTNQTTLRYDCYIGSMVPYYNGSNDLLDTVSSCEVTDAMVSAASAGQVVAGQVYDVWWVHGGANRICIAMSASSGGGGGWASDTGGSNTARGTGYSQLDRTTRPYITNKNSISNCFNGATNYGSVSANQGTYLGTVVASANGQISYTFGTFGATAGQGTFGVWNMYNRRPVASQTGATGSFSNYTTANVWREAFGATTMQAQYVVGLAEDAVNAVYSAISSSLTGSSNCAVGIGIDNTATFSGITGLTSVSANATQIIASYGGVPGVGLHTISANEFVSAVSGCAFYGTAGTAYIQTGLTVNLVN